MSNIRLRYIAYALICTQYIQASFEQRYNANSFILNNTRYFTRYMPQKQSLGNPAIKKIMKKKKKSRITQHNQ